MGFLYSINRLETPSDQSSSILDDRDITNEYACMYLIKNNSKSLIIAESIFAQSILHCCCMNKAQDKNCLLPLYIPTQQNAPTQDILFQFQIKIFFLSILHQKFKSNFFFLLFCKKNVQIMSYFYYTFCEIKKKDLLPTYRLDTLSGQ
jgi:hypothetical protein